MSFQQVVQKSPPMTSLPVAFVNRFIVINRASPDIMTPHPRFNTILAMVQPVEASGTNMPVHTEIEIAELHQLLANPGCTALVVDVREPEEFARGHLPGAVNWPLSRLDERLATLPRDRALVLYSGHGAWRPGARAA